MKKIALWLSVMALGLCLGCTPEPEPTIKIDLKFRIGQEVNLVIGGRGQIIEVHQPELDWHGRMTSPYRVRINTDEGPKYMWFREFELEVSPWEPS